MATENKYVSLKDIGDVNFKLKDIYKTIVFVVGLISTAIYYREDGKSNNSKLVTNFTEEIRSEREKRIEGDNKNVYQITNINADLKVMDNRLSFHIDSKKNE